MDAPNKAYPIQIGERFFTPLVVSFPRAKMKLRGNPVFDRTLREVLNSLHATTSRPTTVYLGESLGGIVSRLARDPAVVVVSKTGAIAGVVSRSHLLRQMRIAGIDNHSAWSQKLVESVMTPAGKLPVLRGDDTLLSCLRMVTHSSLLPVSDKENLIGLVTLVDLVGYLVSSIDSVPFNAKARFLDQSIGLGPDTKLPLDLDRRSDFLQLSCGTCLIPHPQKVQGEDAYFEWHDSTGTVSCIGVADGVGMWSDSRGVDVSRFSHVLVNELKEAVSSIMAKTLHIDEFSVVSPALVLQQAWTAMNTLAMKAINGSNPIIGSSTICMIMLDGRSRELKACNIGDSGFIVVRFDKAGRAGSIDRQRSDADIPIGVVFRSTQQVHYFNCPYQLGIDESGSSLDFENPGDCDRTRIPVIEDDLIILATDGLFDNLTESDILDLIVNAGRGSDLNALARSLADAAYKNSLDTTVDSPFALLAKDNDILYSGGVPDDITVIVSRVLPSSPDAKES